MKRQMKLVPLVFTLLMVCIVSCNAGITEGISFEHELVNGQVKIKTSYWSDYGNGTWKITDNKNLWIKLEVVEQPENWTILIEHMHADCIVEATQRMVDGILQDTMDDKLHVGTQAGFYVDEKRPYYECFSVEGYSKWLIDAWMFIFSGYGFGGATEKRLTEKNIRNMGAIGSEFAIVYDILIYENDRNYFYKEIIYDDFIVNFTGGFTANVGGTSEYTIEDRLVMPFGVQGFIVTVVGIAILICGLLINDYRHPRARKAVLTIGIMLMIAGVILAFWGAHIEQVKVEY